MASKPFYASKTFWGSIMMLVSAISLKFGHEITPENVDLYVNLGSTAGEAVGLALTLYGRAMVKTSVTLRKRAT